MYYYQLRVKAICDGLPADSWVSVNGGSSVPTPSSNDYMMAVSSFSSTPDFKFKSTAQGGETIVGWYLDSCCTQLLKTGPNPTIYSSSAGVIDRYATEAEVVPQTIYAKFTKGENVNWTTVGKSFLPDIPSAGKYYIRHLQTSNFLYYDSSDQKLKANAVDINDALLFTLTRGEGGAATISAVIGNETKYLNQDGSGLTASPVTHTIEYNSTKRKESYRVHLAKDDEGGPWYWHAPNNSEANTNITTCATGNNGLGTQCWFFIPESEVLNRTSVYAKKSDGSVTISESPTAQGTAYVRFRVSTVGNASRYFTYSLSNETNWVMGTPTRCDNIITVPVTYTAQNIHSGSETPASTTTVTLTAKNDAATTASATATAYVDLQPDFEMAASTVDWSTKQVGEEIYNVGMEVAASQRERLQNKLVYSSANLFAQNATWTATITNDAAGNFKFANGTQSVSGPYSAELLDVIYAPKAEGTHTATLRIEVSYTDGKTPTPQTLTCVREVALSGKAHDVSMLTMTLNNSETSFTSYTHELGNIIGTNSKYDTIDLYIHGVTELSKSWSASEGAFEFDVNTIGLSKTNQRLIIRAHRTTPVTSDENYTATLTISGKDGSSNDVSATFTLNYTAKPLIPTTVTWNWEELVEDGTYTNPITTNSDGEWTLDQRDGNGGMTYDAETKSITTEYMHHEPGYKGKFELNIPQTDSYTAYRDTTLETTIVEYIPAAIEINSEDKFLEYVEVVGIVGDNTEWLPENNAMNVKSSKVWFKWSGQSTLAFDFEAPIASSTWKIIEMYEDGTEQKTYDGPFYNGQHHEFAVSPNTYKLRLEGNNKLKKVRYFEYDTIDVDYHGITFLEGGADHFDVTSTFANKRAVTVSLNAAAQEYFELRATGKPTGSSLVYNDADGLGIHKMAKDKVFTVAIKAGVDFAEAKAAAKNGFQVTLQDNYTYNSEVVVLPIALEESYQVTYKHDANGSYKVTYHDDMEHPHTVAADKYVHTVTSIVETNCTATLSEPVPASGYMFRGWKVNDNLVSCQANYTLIPGNGAVVEPIFVVAEEAVYKIDDAVFADLDVALSTAGSIAATKPVVVLQKDVTLSEPATHTIPAGVTLLIPYKANFSELQVTPEITTTATPLSAYRTLTLKEGVNIVCNGTICVSAKIMAAGGGNKSAYTTGECGVINMATGGHIELNNGAHLYCWGYIKGQDMDQGNNTVGTGTITVNAGAVVHENFELGDWRGGTASSNIYFEKDDKHLFPFQSYALQNVEIPTTYTYGSKLETFIVVNTGFGSVPFAVSMIGSEQTLFLLKNAGSVIRKWYDPTTDLCCYELSGTAQLDELTMNLPFVGEFKSGSCNLPVSNSMHIILTDCNMTLSKRLMVQAGAVVEIKPTATIDLTAEVHLFDKDEWGLYIHNYYFRSFNNLTSHKNRGAENSKEGLEDAKFIIDGTLNVKAGQGYIYSTAGGANLMGNGGGKIVFEGALPTASQLWQVTVLGQKPYITWVPTNEAAANLCNEDGSYTKSYGGYTFYNVHGRWFDNENNNEKADHTYDFSYYPTNDVSGDETWTSAVYSHDKTGLEARMKWFNVTPDANCPDWWIGSNPAAFYNYNMLSDWHQFMTTETDNVYSGSDNKLYQKDECLWFEKAAVDENCLYTIDGVKKALVDGDFIPLTSNGYDPAYHKTDDASKYFICFAGCNWHPATPYSGESKAYTINPETGVYLHYIWFNNDWMNVAREEPFFYTEDEITNVRTYYEYVNGEWEIATPYVSVTDAAETRTFYMIKEAFNVAQIKKNATITLLRDIPNVSERLSYETQNTTCTLDLNGHLLAGEIDSLIYVNAPGATFSITDNTTLKLGKIRTTKTRAIFVKAGTVEVNNGTIEATPATGAAYAIYGAAAATININGGYFLAQGNSSSKCVHAAGTYAITGGYYNINTGLANYTVDAYPFANDDPVYKWVVEAAWTIIFKNGETTLQTLHLHPGEMPVYTAAFPTLDNHQFTGWNPAVAAATANVTYQAQFAELEGEKKCVTFNANGGNATLPYKYVTSGDPVGDLPTATKAGHTFTGWFTETSAGTEVTSSTTVSADVTYYAHYAKNSYTLTWNANGATITSADDAYTHGSVEYGTAIIVPSVSKEGWTFDGWNVTPASTMPAANTTYTAQWTIPYTVQHKQQNLNDAEYTVFETDNFTAKSGEYVTPAVKTYDGFITPKTQTVRIGETMEVTYQYARREYTIILDANGGECATASIEVLHGATPTLPEASKEGYTFDGWFTKAVGGDQITNETVIQRNIGTLYAQFTEGNPTETVLIAGNGERVTITEPNTEADVLIVKKDGVATFTTGGLTVERLILESTGNQSGQLVGVTASNLTVEDELFFDFIPNGETGTQARTWYAVAVPWEVNAVNGIFWKEGNRHLIIGRDFDLIYYDVAKRAAEGDSPACWKYVQHDVDKIMHPGRMYMMYFDPGWKTIRFKANNNATALTMAEPSVTTHSAATGNAKDANWNGIANPAVYHAYLDAGTSYGQVLNNGSLDNYQNHEGSPVYSTVMLSSYKFVVGKPVYVQAETATEVDIRAAVSPSLAPRRVRAAGVPEGAEAVYQLTIAAEDRPSTDNLFIQTAEEKADAYVIGKDLAKGGVAKNNAQLWVNRYGVKLSVNTVAAINGVHEYPLGLSIPTAGEYTIAIESAMGATEDLYLTRDGEAIWNLSNGAYVGSFEKGTHDNYGLRVSAHAPQITTGIDEAVVDAKGETRKVVINDKVFIIRGENVYSVDGQLVK